ncbi:MAG: HDIG domain-containing metalloprotein [Acidobacteriota bacterium]
MKRETALDLVRKNLPNPNLVKHSLAVEACMRELAGYFSEDQDEWGLAGLLHDLDYEVTSEDSSNHGLVTAEMLKDEDISEEIIHAIKAHNNKVEISSKMDIALYSIDPTSGFITAVALMHPSRSLENVNLKRMKKRFKEKSFAKGADREQMRVCEKLDLELEDFLELCLKAMTEISTHLGL